MDIGFPGGLTLVPWGACFGIVSKIHVLGGYAGEASEIHTVIGYEGLPRRSFNPAQTGEYSHHELVVRIRRLNGPSLLLIKQTPTIVIRTDGCGSSLVAAIENDVISSPSSTGYQQHDHPLRWLCHSARIIYHSRTSPHLARTGPRRQVKSFYHK